ncbi:GNAT family N-acetyltransferase [Parahaliea maris]|uniref:GNAT family N-acetyltransferase n=1 Tax=Parahaliea maris TaxID=2716870 RepID=A0A5C8ZVT4_9GAMM|nr:GNAT family N-acetyltransferase [Parahaliea maris]TXS91381.1 GNAT family N-acetyltransferase [Parahaliea maris]
MTEQDPNEVSEQGATIWYLEMRESDWLQPKPAPEGLAVIEAEVPEYRFNRYLYQLVGEPWQWTDKLALSDDAWRTHVESENLRTWVAYHRGSIAGYYELQRQDEDQVELLYFGLAPKFIGFGYGGYLLTHAIRSAWSWGRVRRVWVHTCSDDHEGALNNYKARGFRLYLTEQESGPGTIPG